ncbi:MAG: hypothetical protein WCG40_11085 [Actinomycetes bacterium]
MFKKLMTFGLACSLAGCATVGNKSLDPVGMVVSSTEKNVSKDEFISKFGEPMAVKDLPEHTLLGYRKRSVAMNAWSIVPFVGLVAGGVDEEFTTCIVKVSKATNMVENASCSSEKNFQSNAETMVGDRITDKQFKDIFGAPLKK